MRIRIFTLLMLLCLQASLSFADPLSDVGLFVADREATTVAWKAGIYGARPTISGVVSGSAADQAGLKSGDVILSVGGKKISNTSELRGMTPIKLTVEVLRGSERLQLSESSIVDKASTNPQKNYRALKAVSKSNKRKIALVVGNSNYRYTSPLINPLHDAQMIANTLKEVGFELHGGHAMLDLSREQMLVSIEEFGDRLSHGDVALFYYAGHGVQVGGENFLIPINADIKKEAEIKVKSVELNLLFAKLEGLKKTLNIVILDACRNNPFARTFRSNSSGLAQVAAPSGTLVAFSTAPGQVADDGNRGNSPYTLQLAHALKTPGLSVEEVFKQVRISVKASTDGNQTPWENTSLEGSFYFVDANKGIELDQGSDISRLPVMSRNEPLSKVVKVESERDVQNTSPTLPGGNNLKELPRNPDNLGTPEFERSGFQIFKNVVVDTQSRLMWIKYPNSPSYNKRRDALVWVKRLSAFGYNDWRLPTIEEFKQLDSNSGDRLSTEKLIMNLKRIGFNKLKSNLYWTNNFDDTGGYYEYCMGIGDNASLVSYGPCQIWAVRGL
jgi:hypothetical protein